MKEKEQEGRAGRKLPGLNWLSHWKKNLCITTLGELKASCPPSSEAKQSGGRNSVSQLAGTLRTRRGREGSPGKAASETAVTLRRGVP